jgi:hypothetical protein
MPIFEFRNRAQKSLCFQAEAAMDDRTRFMCGMPE